MDKSGNQVHFICSAGAAIAKKCAEKPQVCTVLFHIYAKPNSSIVVVVVVDELVMFSPFSLNNFKIYIVIYISLFTYNIL